MTDNDFAPIILTPKIRHDVIESPPPGPNDFKSAESSLLIGGSSQQMSDSVEMTIVKPHR
jgi:hypothetical protein